LSIADAWPPTPAAVSRALLMKPPNLDCMVSVVSVYIY
jgi:hypothetical protein